MWLLTELKQKFTRRIFELAHLCTITVIAGIWTTAPDENPPPPPSVSVGAWVKVRVSFRVRGNQTIASEENCPLVGVRISFGVGGNCPRTAIAIGKLFLVYFACLY